MERLGAAYDQAMDEFFRLCRSAEQHRHEEEHAALVLQSCWRGVLQRQELQKLSHVALTIQRCWRGYLGRQRFAAARAAHNKQLREAYFAQQATMIQSCWRGYFSRSRVHDFYRRKAYLASVAAANAAVRADMQLELQEALRHQQQQQEAAAKQHFQSQVGRLHHLASTACIPGIFNPPAAAVTGAVPVVAGVPLEQHLRTASKEQASAAVTKQQQTLRNAAGFCWPSSSPISSQQPAGRPAGKAALLPASNQAASAWARAGSPSGGSSATPAVYQLQQCSRQQTSRRRSSPPLMASPKLSTLLVAAVDDAFAAAAAPNMPDGRFNPALTLQQSAGYGAERHAEELERRINRGVMLTMHNGHTFVALSPNTHHQGQAGSRPAGECGIDAAATSCIEATGSTAVAAPPQQGGSSDGKLHWQQPSHSGSFFSKHLKQHY